MSALKIPGLLFALAIFCTSIVYADNPNNALGQVQISAYGSTDKSEEGLFTADFIVPLYYSSDKDTLVFYNPKDTYTTPDANEMHQGLGLRHIFNDSYILGINAFFDRRQDQYDEWFSQAGVGLEYLSHPLDIRLNWYKPTTGPKTINTTYGFGETGLIQYDDKEEPLQGLDFEVGVPVFDKYTKTRLYLGGYFYQSRLSKDVNGFRARTETGLTKWLSMDTTLNSNINKKVEFYGGLRVIIAFDLSNLFNRTGKPVFSAPSVPNSKNTYLEDRIFERVVRDIDIQGKPSTVQHKAPGAFGNIIYVNNTTAPGGKGTLQSPYTTLVQAFSDPRYSAAGGATIYVNNPGNATDYTGGITLANNVVFWGSGYNGGFNGLHVSGIDPIIDGGSSGSVITLGNNNTVMGLQIQHSDSSGNDAGIYASNVSNGVIKDNYILDNNNGIYIEANNASISGFNISNNTVETNTNDGLNINNTNSGSGTITASDFTISRNTFNNNGKNGMEIDNTNNSTGTLIGSDYTFTGNTFNNNDNGGMDIANVNGSTGAFIASNYAFTGNTFNNNGNGGLGIVNVNGSTGTFIAFNYAFTGNTFNDNSNSSGGAVGLFLANNNNSNGTLTASDYTFTGNTFNDNSSSTGGDIAGLGLAVVNSNDSGTLTASDYTFTGNTFTGNTFKDSGSGGGVGLFLNNDNSTGTLTASDYTLTGNIFNGNSSNDGPGVGLFLNNNNSSTGTLTLSDYTFTGNTFNDNSSNSAEGFGLFLNNNNSSTGTLTGSDYTFTGNTFNNNSSSGSGQGAGLVITNQNSGTLTASNYTFTGNTINNNSGNSGGVGLYLENLNSSGTLTASGYTFTENTFDNNTGGSAVGMYLNNNNSSTGTLTASDYTFTENTFNNNVQGGLFLENDNSTGTLIVSDYTFAKNTFNNNGDGLIVMNNDSSTLDMTFSYNTITGNGSDGVLLQGDATSGINFGNGTTGGDNSIYGNDQLSNGSYDLDNQDGSLTLPAEDNWWGQSGGPVTGQISGSVDASQPLFYNPN